MSDLRYAHVIGAVLGTPWAITPQKLTVILDLLAFRAAGGRLTDEEIQAQVGAASRPQPRLANQIAVLPLFGVIAHRMGALAESSGGTSVERFAGAFRQALRDPAVGAVVIDVDSPGGTVGGVDELAAEIYGARGPKPILALANNMAASAAYWLGTAADEVSVTPTGEVGSIGVLAAHEDLSRQLEQQGVGMSIVSAGRFKGELSPYGPLTAEARAALQSRVDDYYDMFVRAVARNRDVTLKAVREGMGEGRLVGARMALAERMVDHVETMDELLARVGQKLSRRNGAAAPVAVAEPVAFMAGPCPTHHTETMDVPWDGPANEARARSGEDAAYYHRIYAWQDPDGDPATKAAYRFIHHVVAEGGNPGAANTTACTTGIGILNGGRGGTTIPDADRPGVHRHLAMHLRDAGREPPPLRSEALAAEIELRRRRLRIVAGPPAS